MEATNAHGDFRQITRRTRKCRPSQALLTQFGCKFITLSVHLCLQHICHDVAHRMSSSATDDTCIGWILILLPSQHCLIDSCRIPECSEVGISEFVFPSIPVNSEVGTRKFIEIQVNK